MIPDEIKNKILDAANIIEVISDYVTLKKKGQNYIGRCPFHDERTSSFFVSPSKGIFKCFGCGKGGNVAGFLMEHEHISFPSALEILAKKYNIIIPNGLERTPEEKKKDERRSSLFTVNRFAMEYFHSNLQHTAAKAFVEKRGLLPETLEQYKIGYALPGWEDFHLFAKRQGFSTQMLKEAGLLSVNEKGGYFDRFRDRLMFPFFDLNGNITGFTGRLILDNPQQAKYLNTEDTEIFHKGKTIYGLYQAKSSISKNNNAYWAEGNIDVLSVVQKGLPNIVCGSGTALTPEQIKIISRFTENVTTIYDGDAAGFKATFRSTDLMLQEGVNVTSVILPEGEDPDSFARSTTPENLAKCFENSKGFIQLKWEILQKEAGDDPMKLSTAMNDVIMSIALIPDEVRRTAFIRQATDIFKFPKDVISKAIAKKKIKHTESVTNGWIGLDDETRAEITEKSHCIICLSVEQLIDCRSNDKYNSIAYSGTLNKSHIQVLSTCCQSVFFDTVIVNITEGDSKEEIAIVLLMKQLLESGFEVKSKFCEQLTTEVKEASFQEIYISSIETLLSENEYDNDWKTTLISRGAELLSFCDTTTQTVNIDRYAKMLHIKVTDFKKIIKPYQEKRKSRTTFLNEGLKTESGSRLVFDDPNNLPDYVDKDFFHRWGYFAAQDENSNKLFYVFRTENNGLTNIGNFFMQPLFHVHDPDPTYNKRIVKLYHSELHTSTYLELPSDAMADFGLFRKLLIREGGFVFSKGKQNHFEIIIASTATQFPKCWELKIFGQQHEGFYAFPNAVLVKNEIKYVDDLGLVSVDGKTYYSPAFSKIFSTQRKDSDKFANDRYFMFNPNSETSFEKWAELMTKVYKVQNNGHWALLFAMMSAFRSHIYSIDRLFTALFFIGPTESGKTQIALSVRSLFMHPDAPLFNLNSGSDAAFFTMLERYRDVAILGEEYNDATISDAKFQGLKAAVYDGEGKQKRKDASTKDLDVSQVNSAIVLLGQEAPERDDGSLSNRSIICHVKKKDDWTEEEVENFQELKRREKNGLSNVLIQVLQKRPLVERHFQPILRKSAKELKERLVADGYTFQTRIINTVSLFLAMVKLWEEHVTDMKLPFTYNEFFEIAIDKITTQSEQLNRTNRLAMFFDSISVLLNKVNGLTMGKELKIENDESVTIISEDNKTTKEIRLGKDTRILYLRINIIQQYYKQLQGMEALKPAALLMYLRDHPAYIGKIKSTRFQWNTSTDVAADVNGKAERHVVLESTNTSAIALNYDLLGVDFDKLQETAPQFSDGRKDCLGDIEKQQQVLPLEVPDLPF